MESHSDQLNHKKNEPDLKTISDSNGHKDYSPIFGEIFFNENFRRFKSYKTII